MRTWQKVALGCGGLLVLGVLLVDEAPRFSRGTSWTRSEGTVGVRIVYHGEVGETTARAGNVSVNRSPNE